MIDRRTFLTTVTLAVLAVPCLGEARSLVARRVPRVGVLGEANPVPWTVRTSIVDIECRWAETEPARLPGMAAELVALDVDVIVALGAESARAACAATAGVPIVVVADGVGEDAAVASLTRSAGNVVWLSVPSEAGMAQQRRTLLGRVGPRLRRVAVLANPDNATNACALARLFSSALGPAGAVCSFPARTVEDVERAFVAMAGDGVDGLLVLPDPLFAIHAARLVELAAEARLPAAYGARTFVEAGGLMALYGDTGEVIRRTVEIVRQILAGGTAATLSLPARLRPQVAFNVPAAKRLGLVVPPALLAAADVVHR